MISASYNPNRPEPVPAGRYRAVAKSCERRPNSKGTGEYLRFDFELLDEPYKGRQLRDWINIEHDNPAVVEIAQKELASIKQAAGVPDARRPSELLGKSLAIQVIIGEGKNPGSRMNWIRGYEGCLDESNQPPAEGASFDDLDCPF